MDNQEAQDAIATAETQNRLASFIRRIENLEEEKKEILGHIKEVFDEAKSEGFDAKVMRKVLSLRKIKPSELEEMEYLLDLYMNALEQTEE